MPIHSFPQHRPSVLLLRTLGNDRRYALIPLFRQHGTLTCADIADLLGIHRYAASKHLRKMLLAGILISRRKGGSVWFRVSPGYAKSLKNAIAPVAL